MLPFPNECIWYYLGEMVESGHMEYYMPHFWANIDIRVSIGVSSFGVAVSTGVGISF